MATLSSSSSSQNDSTWDLDASDNNHNNSIRRTVVNQQPKVETVRDDWDDDDDELDEPTVEQNQKIWEAANAKAPAPMPSVILTSSTAVTPPVPLAAFQPTMRILKRPTNSPSQSSSPSPAPASAETIKEREARYQAARERIFGSSSPENTPDSTQGIPVSTDGNSTKIRKDSRNVPSKSPSPKPTVVPMRRPKGPASDSTSDLGNSNHDGFNASSTPKGFGERRASKKTGS